MATAARSGLATKMDTRISRSLKPRNDGVLVQRIDPKQGTIVLTDERRGSGVIPREGIVLAVGPGKWIPGEWWYFRWEASSNSKTDPGYWDWIPGHREQMEVKPGMRVIFNARWNDLAHQELKGTGCDLKGPLERPLSIRFDPAIHLIQEADIAGILG
jgi:hypothetical protein